MEEEKVEVTVLMSVYKEENEEIKEAIESILKQSFNNFEFLIIDDGQEERIQKLIKGFNDPRIKLIINDSNMGLARSLNKGIELAKGEYIVRMDADDISYPDRIEKQYNFVKKNPQYAVIAGKADIFDQNGIYGTIGKFGKVEKKQLVKGTPFIHPTMLIKKDYIKQIGGYPNYRRAQDYAMIMKLYSKGFKGYIMDDILIKYRMDKNGYKKKKFKYRIMEMKIRAKYYKELKVPLINYIYVLKPIIIGLIPKKIQMIYHNKRMK